MDELERLREENAHLREEMLRWMAPSIFLSRRNLNTLLTKLDRKAEGHETACQIIKRDNQHPTYPQTTPIVTVTAIDDHEYYADRQASRVHPIDELAMAVKSFEKNIGKSSEGITMQDLNEIANKLRADAQD